MTSVSIDRKIAEELVDSKLKLLQNHLLQILTEWNYSSASDFLIHARDGTLDEAEDDAITL